ncbi:hypothetical protein GXM_06901 [Nostoc sphaeroides CCNUC1]|uniref:Uncharacterized protein n=1 Tax=Nostoc sphaeroides CCNUC1 TaxID=2653204 RepID=A0A5P8W9C7_9NOSO|nr:hypothetical protein GXM_06901 [Nostoc sphaeroides CCNUC1]
MSALCNSPKAIAMPTTTLIISGAIAGCKNLIHPKIGYIVKKLHILVVFIRIQQPQIISVTLRNR